MLRVCACFLVSIIRHAKRMHSIILWSVACKDLLYFSTLLHKGQDFRKEYPLLFSYFN